MTFADCIQILETAVKTAKKVVGDDGRTWWEQVCRSHFGDTARGSKFTITPDQVEEVVLNPRNDFTFNDDGKTLIASVDAEQPVGLQAIFHLESIMSARQAMTKVRVESLGDHPALVFDDPAIGDDPIETNRTTFIIEYAGSVYKKDCLEYGFREGEPILATLYPGNSTRKSEPHDCRVGDKMTVAEAYEKGWRAVKLVV